MPRKTQEELQEAFDKADKARRQATDSADEALRKLETRQLVEKQKTLRLQKELEAEKLMDEYRAYAEAVAVEIRKLGHDVSIDDPVKGSWRKFPLINIGGNTRICQMEHWNGIRIVVGTIHPNIAACFKIRKNGTFNSKLIAKRADEIFRAQVSKNLREEYQATRLEESQKLVDQIAEKYGTPHKLYSKYGTLHKLYSGQINYPLGTRVHPSPRKNRIMVQVAKTNFTLNQADRLLDLLQIFENEEENQSVQNQK